MHRGGGGGGGGRNLLVERYKFLDSRGHVMVVQPTCPSKKRKIRSILHEFIGCYPLSDFQISS